MEKLKSFIDVNKRIVLNLIELDEQNASQRLIWMMRLLLCGKLWCIWTIRSWMPKIPSCIILLLCLVYLVLK